jgi:hypothetical protein
MKAVVRSTGLSTLGVLSVVPLLAGCASAEIADESQSDMTTPQSEEATTPMESETMGDAPVMTATSWKDGTYNSSGGYQSPNGPETVDVSITVANNVITEIVVTPNASNSTSQRYQGQFAEGISVETVGKPLDALSVSRVSGSSLTSGGFNQALEAIKADATS